MKYCQWVLFYFFYSIKLFFINFFWLVWLFVYIVNDCIFNMLPSCPFPLCYFLFFFFFWWTRRGMGTTIVIHPLKRDHRGTLARYVISLMCSNLMRMIRLPKKKKKEAPFLLWWKLPFYTHACFWIFLLQMIRCNFWAIGSN